MSIRGRGGGGQEPVPPRTGGKGAKAWRAANATKEGRDREGGRLPGWLEGGERQSGETPRASRETIQDRGRRGKEGDAGRSGVSQFAPKPGLGLVMPT